MINLRLAELKTVKCKIKLIHPTHNNYTLVIAEVSPNEYIPVSIPYNYEFNFKEGSTGILTYEEALAGLTDWYSKEDNRYYKHNYTVYYFKYFVPENNIAGKETDLYFN